MLPLLDVPVSPSPDDGRAWLRRELLQPEYHRQNVVEKVLDWVDRVFGRAMGAAAHHSWLTTLAAMVIFALLVTALGWLVSRARATEHTRRERRAVLTDELISADELRARAQAALADGRCAEALVDAYRAVATRQVERGMLPDDPGTTAHEVALVLVAQFPHRRADIVAAADRFDQVLYGDRPATPRQVEDVLALDLELVATR
ncbi:MAG: DUF4129 domain-containing protein [Nocardioides sp.]